MKHPSEVRRILRNSDLLYEIVDFLAREDRLVFGPWEEDDRHRWHMQSDNILCLGAWFRKAAEPAAYQLDPICVRMIVYDDNTVEASIEYADQGQSFWRAESRRGQTEEELREILDEKILEDGHILCDKPSPFLDLEDFTSAKGKGRRLKDRTVE